MLFLAKKYIYLTSTDHLDLIISELKFQFLFTVWVWVPGFSAMHWLGNLNIAELGYHCCCYKVKVTYSTPKFSLFIHLIDLCKLY